MRLTQIEAWALKVADDIMQGRPNEDARVEIKSKWLDANVAARRIAGHANAAHGEPILWLIGIDEKKREVLGADKNDMASWYPQVQAEFNDLAPYVTDLNIPYPYEGKWFVALLFGTERAPYVVKNPSHGSQGAGPVSLEVPWREGTSTRSATRSDLIRVLVPLAQMPTVEVLTGYLRANLVAQGSLGWYLEMQLYIVASSQSQIVFPFHKCSVWVGIPDERRQVTLNKVYIESYPKPAPGTPSSLTVRSSQTEAIIESVGMVKVSGYGVSVIAGGNIGDSAKITIHLVQAHDARPIIITHHLSSSGTDHEEISGGHWGLWGTPMGN